MNSLNIQGQCALNLRPLHSLDFEPQAVIVHLFLYSWKPLISPVNVRFGRVTIPTIETFLEPFHQLPPRGFNGVIYNSRCYLSAMEGSITEPSEHPLT